MWQDLERGPGYYKGTGGRRATVIPKKELLQVECATATNDLLTEFSQLVTADIRGTQW